jgi:cytoskeletal protein RodZ
LAAIIAGTAIIIALIAYLGFSLLRGQSSTPTQTPPALNAPTPGTPATTPAPSEPRTVSLSVISKPSGATVFLDGIRVGVTPLSGAPVTAGLSRELKLELPGYQTETRSLDIERPRNLSVALRPAPKPATTTPGTTPAASGAVVLTFTGSSWIRVIDDSGRVVYEGIPASDARLSFTPPVRVRAGRPDLVNVTIGTNTRKLGNAPSPTTVRLPAAP